MRSLEGAVLTESQYEGIIARLARHGAYYSSNKPKAYASHALNLSAYWDSNVNSGNPTDQITLGNITLQGDPELVKEEDLVGAFSYQFNSSLVFGDQSWFDFNYQHKYGKGLNTGHELNFNKVTLCSNLKLYSDLYIDGCYFDWADKKTLNTNSSTDREIKFSYLLNGNKLFSLGRLDTSTPETYNFISISQALTSGKLLEARITKSTTGGRRSAQLGYGFYSSEYAYKASFSWKDYGSSWFIGFPKEQVVKGLGVSVITPSGYNWRIEYQLSSSNIDFFNQSNVSFSFGNNINLF